MTNPKDNDTGAVGELEQKLGHRMKYSPGYRIRNWYANYNRPHFSTDSDGNPVTYTPPKIAGIGWKGVGKKGGS